MRLVLEYNDGDGYTYGYTVALPIEYESAEALLVDFDEAMNNAHKNNDARDINIGGHNFYCGTFFENGKYWPPTIYTIDEWFANI